MGSNHSPLFFKLLLYSIPCKRCLLYTLPYSSFDCALQIRMFVHIALAERRYFFFFFFSSAKFSLYKFKFFSNQCSIYYYLVSLLLQNTNSCSTRIKIFFCSFIAYVLKYFEMEK